jgi:hypothetical protein
LFEEKSILSPCTSRILDGGATTSADGGADAMRGL